MCYCWQLNEALRWTDILSPLVLSDWRNEGLLKNWKEERREVASSLTLCHNIVGFFPSCHWSIVKNPALSLAESVTMSVVTCPGSHSLDTTDRCQVVISKPCPKNFTFDINLEMFHLNSTLNFGIPPLGISFKVYYMVDRLLTGLAAQQKGTTARWYSNKTSLIIKLIHYQNNWTSIKINILNMLINEHQISYL